MQENRLIFFLGDPAVWEKRVNSNESLINKEVQGQLAKSAEELQPSEEIKEVRDGVKNLVKKTYETYKGRGKKILKPLMQLAVSPIEIIAETSSLVLSAANLVAIKTPKAIASIPLAAGKALVGIGRAGLAVPVKLGGMVAKVVGAPSRMLRKAGAKATEKMDNLSAKIEEKKDVPSQKIDNFFN